MYNVCGTVSGDIPKTCATLTGINQAGAIQVDARGTSSVDDDFCFVVGLFESTTSLKLIDQSDPSKGVKLTYYGDYCHNPPNQRAFNIELICADRLNPVATHALETSHCVYEISIPSVYGCPLECPVANRRLCGGNGHCAYDIDKSAARCFCNHGFSGKDCNTEGDGESLSYSPALMGLIITLFVIICLLVGGILLMIRQLAAYKEDVSNYQALKGDDMNDL